MDIALAVLVIVGAMGMALTGGLLLADTWHRREALTRVEEGERRNREAAEALKAEVVALVKTINEAHNGLVKNVADIDAKVQDLGTRITMIKAGSHAPAGKNPFQSPQR